MAYRKGNRTQLELFPSSYEEYIGAEDPVRAYDAFVDALDEKQLGLEIDPRKVGNSNYDPKTMLKLLIYGMSYGWRSSRKLERALYHNVSFMWLMGGMKPDHKTISEFRRNNKKTLKKVLKLCCRMCCGLGLIEGNVLFTDGTKIRANGGRSQSYTYEWYKANQDEVAKRIEDLLEKCEDTDREESTQGSLVKMKKELVNAERLREKIVEAIGMFEERGIRTVEGKERKVNITDPESAIMRSAQGSHNSYNVQSVVDGKNGLIAHIDAVDETEDSNQLSRQVEQAEDNTQTQSKISCADSGYSNIAEQEKLALGDRKVIVPSQRQSLHGKENPFSKRYFRYDKESNSYYCPENKKLRYLKRNKKAGCYEYIIEDPKICHECKHYGVCTNAQAGRKVTRMYKEELREYFEALYEEGSSQEIYSRRKECCEHPFGHIKRNLNFTNFLIRGKQGARAEISMAATCFNIARMLTIFGGVQQFIGKIQTLS